MRDDDDVPALLEQIRRQNNEINKMRDSLVRIERRTCGRPNCPCCMITKAYAGDGLRGAA